MKIPARKNQYDGEDEYLVTIRKSGSHEKIAEKEERQTEVSKAAELAASTCLNVPKHGVEQPEQTKACFSRSG